VVACRPWLLAELDAVRPEVLVFLGATAAKALLGNDFRVTAHRGQPMRLPEGLFSFDLDPQVVATVHPSSILRGDPAERAAALAAFVADLQVAAGLLAPH
jgi:DNA polymerase